MLTDRGPDELITINELNKKLH